MISMGRNPCKLHLWGANRETTMTLTWIAQRLNMGAPGSLANLLRNGNKK